MDSNLEHSQAALRIGLISTQGTNLGDDLVREGVLRILRASTHLPIVPVSLNKHRPLQIYPRWHPARWLGGVRPGSTRVSKLSSVLFSWLHHSQFDTCDAIIYAGTPLLWENCHQCEWAAPIWDHVVKRLSVKVPVMILGGGSCYAWERQPQRLCHGPDLAFLETVTGLAQLVTVRDSHAKQLLPCHSEFLPCPAFVAVDGMPPQARDDTGRVLFNFMAGAGHYDYGQKIDHQQWSCVAEETIVRVKREGHDVAFLCHDDAEVRLAQSMAPELEIFYPRNASEYATVARQARAAICNRLHACVSLAGLGVPSVAVGVDSRLHMVSALGLPARFVKDVCPEMLAADVNALLQNRERECRRLMNLKQKTLADYVALVSPLLGSL